MEGAYNNDGASRGDKMQADGEAHRGGERVEEPAKNTAADKDFDSASSASDSDSSASSEDDSDPEDARPHNADGTPCNTKSHINFPKKITATAPAMVEAMISDSSVCPRVTAEEAKEQINRAWQSRQMPPDDDFFVELLTANNGSNRDPYARHRHSQTARKSRRRSRSDSMMQDIVKARNSFIKDSDKAWIYAAIRAIIALECIRQEGYAKPVGPEVLDEDDVLLEKRVRKREQSILRVFNLETAGKDAPPKVMNADFCKRIDVAERRMRMLMAVTTTQLERRKRLAGAGRARARSSSVVRTIDAFVDRAALDLDRPLPLASMPQACRPYAAHNLARSKSLSLASPRAAGYYMQAMTALPGNEALRKSFERNVPAPIREAANELKIRKKKTRSAGGGKWKGAEKSWSRRQRK